MVRCQGSCRNNCKHANLFKPVSGTGLEVGPRRVTIVPESDFHRLIMRSTLPVVEKFQEWVFEKCCRPSARPGDIVPAVRKKAECQPSMKGEETIKGQDLIPFEYEDRPVRVIKDETGELWWMAKAVAKVLRYAHTDQAVRIHCKYSKLFKTGDSPVLEIGPRGALIIPESDLYRLIMRSSMPDAEKFQDWVVEEVCPLSARLGNIGCL